MFTLMMAHSMITVKNNLLTLAVTEKETRELMTTMANKIADRFEILEEKYRDMAVTQEIHGWLLTFGTRNYHKQPEKLRLLQIVREAFLKKQTAWNFAELPYLHQALINAGLDWEKEITLADFIDDLIDEIEAKGFHVYDQLIALNGANGRIEQKFILENVSVPSYKLLYEIAENYSSSSKIIDRLAAELRTSKKNAMKKVLRGFIEDEGIDTKIKIPMRDLAVELLGCHGLVLGLVSPVSIPVQSDNTPIVEIEKLPTPKKEAIKKEKNIHGIDLYYKGQPIFDKEYGSVKGIAFSPNSLLLAVAFQKCVKIFDTNSGLVRDNVPVNGDISDMQFASDNSELIVTCGKYIWICDLATKSCSAFGGEAACTRDILSIALSLEDKFIVYSSYNSLFITDVKPSYNKFEASNSHSGEILSVAISLDCKWFVSAGNDGTIKIWGYATKQCLRVLKGHTDWVRSVVISPDGKWIISAGDDNTIRIWDAINGQCLQILKNHTGKICTVTISADGKWLASIDNDDVLLLWAITKGKCLLVNNVKAYCSKYTKAASVAISPDGKYLAAQTDYLTVQLYEVSIETN